MFPFRSQCWLTKLTIQCHRKNKTSKCVEVGFNHITDYKVEEDLSDKSTDMKTLEAEERGVQSVSPELLSTSQTDEGQHSFLAGCEERTEGSEIK